VDVTKLSEGLWRWTAPHPEWTPDEGGPDGWDREVASLYLEGPDHVVLIDPLVPADERDRFFEALDRDVERARRPVAIVLSLYDHERSAAELGERYDAEVWAPAERVERIEAHVAHPFAAGDTLPGGIETLDAGRRGEVLVWIPAHGTLFTGDAILGSPQGLRRCPDSWTPDGLAPERFRAILARVLQLPVRRVVPAHGEVVEDDALARLRDAIES
jgi:glyoxylase-like metal-dependent hydrolase (beta-lactamase superfamily II)